MKSDNKKGTDVCSFLFNSCIPDDVNVAHFLFPINAKEQEEYTLFLNVEV